MRKIALFAVILVTTFFSNCKKEDAGGMNDTDYKFMSSATSSDLAEIDFGNLALSKSETDSVLTFASLMVADHTANLSALRGSLARQLNFNDLPSTIDTAHQALKIKISNFAGYTFDTAYINGQIKDHQTAITLYKSEINSGFNKSIKAFASQHLPMLEMHLERAKSVSKSLHP